MAQTKTNGTTAKAELNQLSDQIETLKSDIAAITKTLADLGKTTKDAAVTGAKAKATELRDTGEQQMRAAQARAEDYGHQAAEAVRNQPAAAVGIAAGLGFLIGFLTARK